MKVRTYTDARSFLENTQVALESNQVANSLLLGICLRLARHPERVEPSPCLKTVQDGGGLVLAAVMTPPYKLVVVGHQGDLEAGALALAQDLIAGGWPVPGVLGPRAAASAFAARWAELTGQRWELEQRQRVYELRKVKAPPPTRGRLRRATKADLDLVARWRYGVYAEIHGQADREEARRVAERGIEDRDVYLWEDEVPVSMAAKTRPTRHGISVSRVYTPPEWRGRGYATACVGELSRKLLDSGWSYCVLFADLDNAAANRVYQKIGYEPVCDYEEYGTAADRAIA